MKSKTTVSNQSPYANLTAPGKIEASRTVVIDLENVIHVGDAETMDKHYDKKEHAFTARFDTLEEFSKLGKNTILAHHEERLGKVPKDTSLEDATLMVWAHFVKEGKPHLPETKVDGSKERKSSYASREYTLLTHPGTVIKTPQAQACYKILSESVNPETKKITEADLKKAVETRAAELKTRQDPWRIFQYYRPTLIKEKFIAHN